MDVRVQGKEELMREGEADAMEDVRERLVARMMLMCDGDSDGKGQNFLTHR